MKIITYNKFNLNENFFNYQQKFKCIVYILVKYWLNIGAKFGALLSLFILLSNLA